MPTQNEWLDDLRDDHDTVELDDGTSVVLRVEPDDITNPFEEYDCYGKIEEGRRTDYSDNDRPEGFDGNAEKLSARSGMVWWQPPRGDYKGPSRGTDGFRQMRQLALDLLEYGTQYWVLAVLDADGVELDSEAMGGIEPFPTDEYRRDLLEQLWDEIEYRAETRESRAATALVRALVGV